jgi:hypothetical protein
MSRRQGALALRFGHRRFGLPFINRGVTSAAADNSSSAATGEEPLDVERFPNHSPEQNAEDGFFPKRMGRQAEHDSTTATTVEFVTL